MPSEIYEITRAARQILRDSGDFAEAEALLLKTWELATHGAEVAIQADVAHRLAATYRDHGHLEEAEPFARQAVALEERAGRVALLGNHLMFHADLLTRSTRYEEALPYAEQGVRCYEEASGPDHSETAYMRSVVASLRRKLAAG